MDRSRMSPESSSSSSDSSPSPRSRDALNDDDDIKHEMGVSLEQTAESKKQSKKRQKRSCKPCQVAHACCDNQLPCSRCERLGRGHLCYYTAPKRRGRKRKHDEESSSPPVDPLVLIQNPEVPLRTLLQRVLVEMLEMKNKQARLEDHMMTLLTHTTSSQAADHRHQQRRQRQQQQQQHRHHQQTGADADEAHLQLDQQQQQHYGGTSSGGEESALSASLLASLLGGVGASMSAPDLTLDHRAQLYRDSDGVTTPTTAAAAEALMAAASSTPANEAMHDPSYLQRVLRVRCAQHSQPCVVLSFTAQDPLTPPTILCCNESFEQTVGFTFTEMRGRPYLELVLPAARELTHAELCRLWQTPSQSDLEIRGLLRLLAKHQDSVELSTTLLVCFDQHGLPAACLAVGVERESSSGPASSSSTSSSSSTGTGTGTGSSGSIPGVGLNPSFAKARDLKPIVPRLRSTQR